METSDNVNKATSNNPVEQLQGAKILLVEDNDLNQELIQEILRMNGLSSKVANNGQEALDMLVNEVFDGVLMDCQMPVMDGYEATRKIREQEAYKDLPIIALTGSAIEGDRQEVISEGMNDLIAKPINTELMFATMAKWIKLKG